MEIFHMWALGKRAYEVCIYGWQKLPAKYGMQRQQHSSIQSYTCMHWTNRRIKRQKNDKWLVYVAKCYCFTAFYLSYAFIFVDYIYSCIFGARAACVRREWWMCFYAILSLKWIFFSSIHMRHHPLMFRKKTCYLHCGIFGVYYYIK